MPQIVTNRAALVAGALCIVLTLGVWPAQAQPFSPTINPNAIPVTVSQQPEKVAVRPKVSDQELVNLAFGATVNSGNTKTFAGTLGGRLGLIRGKHQLTFEALGSMGGARQERLTDVEWIARNGLGRLRYDLFLSAMDALFLAIAPRRDTFAGLDLRLQNQIGYLRNLFFTADSHRLWSELGYDFTYDNFAAVETTETTDITDEVRQLEAAAGIPMEASLLPEGARATRTLQTMGRDRSNRVHSARIFFGYTNRLFASANLSLGVETLLDFQDKRNVRVNGLVELTSSITHSFKLGLQSRVLFDNVPVDRTYSKYDTIIAVQLVYTYDSQAGVLNAPCPICDCTQQVEAARAACRTPR